MQSTRLAAASYPLLALVLFVRLAALESTGRADEGPPNTRPPTNEQDLRYWLENMIVHHRFSAEEVQAATGLPLDQVQDATRKFRLQASQSAPKKAAERLLVMPYPGGRHPRIGFLEGAIQPQRETKFSAFLPWDQTSYVVVNAPEAIWWKVGDRPELLYLAHTHIPTTWDRQNIALDKLEWRREKNHRLVMERELPNGIVFGTSVIPTPDSVRMEMWLTNGSREQVADLRVQNCVMLKGAPEFAAIDNDNKVSRLPYTACRSATGNRWIITAWLPCHRVWANANCPCMHSDPKFPDCAPGETQRLQGWLSFYEGEDIQQEFDRIERTKWYGE